MTESIGTTGYAVNDFFASIRNGWIAFRLAAAVRRNSRFAYWHAERRRRDPVAELDDRVSGWMNDLCRRVETLEIGRMVADDRIQALEGGTDEPEPAPAVERMWFCPHGHNAYTTSETYPECAACGATMTPDQDAFEAACEASDILRHGPM